MPEPSWVFSHSPTQHCVGTFLCDLPWPSMWKGLTDLTGLPLTAINCFSVWQNMSVSSRVPWKCKMKTTLTKETLGTNMHKSRSLALALALALSLSLSFMFSFIDLRLADNVHGNVLEIQQGNHWTYFPAHFSWHCFLNGCSNHTHIAIKMSHVSHYHYYFHSHCHDYYL